MKAPISALIAATALVLAPAANADPGDLLNTCGTNKACEVSYMDGVLWAGRTSLGNAIGNGKTCQDGLQYETTTVDRHAFLQGCAAETGSRQRAGL